MEVLTTVESFDRVRDDAFFCSVLQFLPRHTPVSSVVITHLLADGPAFLRAVARISDLRVVLPKPKSVDRATLLEVSGWVNCDRLTRERLADPQSAVGLLEQCAAGEQLVLLDVGGYFASTITEVWAEFSGDVVGVVEDTENGFRR